MRKHELKEDAFTGLEAAIVLIAFVVVAAVFSYVVLGAGFFTTQKSQETIYAGVGQSTSNIEIVGPVSVNATTAGTGVSAIMFKIKPAAGASDIDLQKMTFTITTKNVVADFVSSQVGWIGVGTFTDPDMLLKSGEIMEIVVPGGSTMLPSLTPPVPIGTSETFSIEIKPAIGAPLMLQKTTPAGMSPDGYYELY
ncbi:MAG: flagellin [Methanoregulaceae archaeon PtaU1.Bin222]|nr:MAG: flagellin [Methanoregulaceae archaeon PtaU1.Bin222]